MVRPVRSEQLQAPWRVRICDASGVVLGAGMVLGTGHVLTCAHVIARAGGQPPVEGGATPGVQLTVELVGPPDRGTATARVAPGGWVPPGADDRGDVALLELGRTLPDGCGAPLRRMPLSWARPARTYGFPAGHAHGLWVEATVGGPTGPGGEWVQMNARNPAHQVREGFSGGAVIDGETGYVVGMTAARNTDEAIGVWYMLPVETIVRYLSPVADWVSGEGVSDPRSAQSFDPWVDDVGFAREVAAWCASLDTRRVWVTVVGNPGSARSAALRRAVMLADREKRPQDTDHLVADAPAGTVPEVGSIGLAVDAAGRTAEQVSQRILDRLSVQSDESSAPSDQVRVVHPLMTLVVSDIDAAAEPAVLVDEVLRPLAEQGCRLLLAFRSADAPSLTAARSLAPPVVETESLGERVKRLDGRVTDVGAAEEAARRRHRGITARFSAAPDVDVPDHAISLRLRVTALLHADVEREPERIAATLGRTERAAERAMQRARTALQQLDTLRAALEAERGELRGRLEPYRARAASHGFAEDAELGDRYREARELLGHVPCDLRLARAAVERYLQAVRRKLDGGREEAAP